MSSWFNRYWPVVRRGHVFSVRSTLKDRSHSTLVTARAGQVDFWKNQHVFEVRTVRAASSDDSGRRHIDPRASWQINDDMEKMKTEYEFMMTSMLLDFTVPVSTRSVTSSLFIPGWLKRQSSSATIEVNRLKIANLAFRIDVMELVLCCSRYRCWVFQFTDHYTFIEKLLHESFQTRVGISRVAMSTLIFFQGGRLHFNNLFNLRTPVPTRLRWSWSHLARYSRADA